jgi:predicted ABC-type ATPase
MPNEQKKKIVILAGPNGAGKTTFAREFLPNEAACSRFLNVDLIAAGLSPFIPEAATFRAGRLMVQEIAACVRRGESFAFETTLSGLRYARLIPQWRKKGYFVKLIFLKLPNPEMGIARVAARVAQGGHAIAEAVIRRRFEAGWRNFQQVYRTLVDAWILYDNALERPEYLDSKGGMHDQ